MSTGYRSNLKDFIDEIELIEGDIRDPGTVEKSMAGVDYVLHQAALASVPRSIENPVLVNDVNVNGTINVLENARKAEVSGLVYAASSSAYGDVEVSPKNEELRPRPLSPYAVSKLAGEHYCAVYSKVYGLRTISIRYFNVFGPRQDPASQYAAVVPIFISKLMKGEKPVIHGDGEQSRDFTYVRNVVSANIMAAQAENTGGEMINVACGDKYTVNRLLEIIKENLGSGIEPVYSDPRPGDVKHSLADISKAEELIGYSVEVDFEEGLKKTIDWYRHNQSG
jgi:nucleoside-diphosphate-sugar epimerase